MILKLMLSHFNTIYRADVYIFSNTIFLSYVECVIIELLVGWCKLCVCGASYVVVCLQPNMST